MVKRPPPRGPTKKFWRRIYLREWREFRGLSQEGLADRSGVSSGQINLIENQKSAGSPDSLQKLAKALDIEIGELLDIKPEPGGRIVRMWIHDEDRPQVEAVAEALRQVKRK